MPAITPNGPSYMPASITVSMCEPISRRFSPGADRAAHGAKRVLADLQALLRASRRRPDRRRADARASETAAPAVPARPKSSASSGSYVGAGAEGLGINRTHDSHSTLIAVSTMASKLIRHMHDDGQGGGAARPAEPAEQEAGREHLAVAPSRRCLPRRAERDTRSGTPSCLDSASA